jgi:hypothetical protein
VLTGLRVLNLLKIVYVADMVHVSNLLGYWYAVKHAMIYSDTPEDTLKQYQQYHKVETLYDIKVGPQTDINHADLIVDSHIQSKATIDIIE